MAKKNKPIEVFVCMTLKKPLPKKLLPFGFMLGREACKAVASIEDDYPEIKVADVSHSLTYTGNVDVCFFIDSEFAKKNMYYDGHFAPEKYIGFYLSRVARRLRKDYPGVAKYYWEPGMFDYEFSK